MRPTLKGTLRPASCSKNILQPTALLLFPLFWSVFVALLGTCKDLANVLGQLASSARLGADFESESGARARAGVRVGAGAAALGHGNKGNLLNLL